MTVINAGRWPQALVDIAYERGRQEAVEGWTPEHDDRHTRGQMATAAACYLIAGPLGSERELLWPWSEEWWKPKDRRRDLVRAGALILAEIERLDRNGYDAEQSCPGHVASSRDPKVCGRCGIHIDSLRPSDEDPR